MNPALIVSPHLDDAVLSCGQLLADRANITVATVFAGTPPDPALSTEYDANCGFRNAGSAINLRRAEDEVAVGSLKGRVAHLNFLDGQYDDERPSTVDIASALLDLAARLQPEFVVMPIGLVHPDHELTADACLAAFGGVPALYAYEDMPSRVLWPESVPPRFDWLRSHGFDFELGEPGGAGSIAKKQRAVRSYRSQLWALNIHAVLVPERFWRITPRSSATLSGPECARLGLT